MALIEMSGITKSFDGSVALDSVDLTVEAGEIHALAGANGAGKSTLGKVLSGMIRPESGEIRVDGRPVIFESPSRALKHGIVIMQQEIALAGHLSVIDNVFLGVERTRRGRVDRRLQRNEFGALEERTGFDVSPELSVNQLSLGEQQEVAILWALARDARLVVMDEPTASLDRADARRLLETARMLSRRGIAVVFVSHFLDEVLSVAQRVTVLTNGRLVGTKPAASLTQDVLIRMMMGKEQGDLFPQLPATPARGATGPVLRAEGVGLRGALTDVSVEVFPGEIVGLYGLVGSGRSEFAHVVAGATKPTGGTILYKGAPLVNKSTSAAIRRGIVLLPESRKDQGLFLERSVAENTSISALARFSRKTGVIRRHVERREVDETLTPLSLRGGNRLHEAVGSLSGGNQQKVLLARCLLAKPSLLILDEPTRGVDIGAKLSIYQIIGHIAALGVAILLISSEQEEIRNLCHRIVVFRRGHVAARYKHGEVDEDTLLASALGVNARGERQVGGHDER